MTRMDCTEVRDLIQAYDDGELPASERTAVAGHLQTCTACTQARTELQRLRATIRASGTFAAPAGLDGRVRAAIGAAGHLSPQTNWRRFTTLAASHVAAVALGGALTYGAFARIDARTTATRDIIAAHVRSVMSDQLLQVASADTHTVKPWFLGRVPFSPDVKDLSAQGFPLLGARLDYVLERPTAALVYGRRKHRVTLFIQAVDPAGRAETFQATRHGYQLVAWSSDGFHNLAVSDLNTIELDEFVRLVRGVTHP